jgi:hypothetical protein
LQDSVVGIAEADLSIGAQVLEMWRENPSFITWKNGGLMVV